MEERSLSFIASACGGELVTGAPAALVRQVFTDSRQRCPRGVFFALPGDRFDGHDFVEQAAETAAAVVVQRGRVPPSSWGRLLSRPCAIISVPETRHALLALAARYRQDFTLPIVAVGGSNGKTTTKELLAAVLRQGHPTLWSEASFNNSVGVPLTLLQLGRSQGAAVLEVGTNHPGELAPLVRVIAPRYGVITSIGREHLEFFGDLNGVAEEEGVLGELLPSSGALFLNGDTACVEAIRQRASARVILAGLGESSQWRARAIRPDREGVSFRAEGPQSGLNGEYRINLLGRHQVVNALLALAVGAELGLTREQVARGLLECRPPKMRLQAWEINGVRVLDDAYNANADSMLAALQTLLDMPCKGRRVAVLGDMAELGAQSEAAHEEVGRRAAELGVAQLFAVGKMAPILARGARNAGLHRVFEFADVQSAGAAIKSFLKQGDVVLLKASRASRLERIAEILRPGEALKN